MTRSQPTGPAAMDHPGVEPGTTDQTYRALLESMDQAVYVCDPLSHELLYANPSLLRLQGDRPDRKCYELFRNREAPCPHCNVVRAGDEARDETHVADYRDDESGRWYRCTDRVIAWPGSRQVRLETAVDITEYLQNQDDEKDQLKRIRDQQGAIISMVKDPGFAKGDFKSAACTLTEYVARTLHVERVSLWLLNSDRTELECQDLYEQSRDTHSEGFLLTAQAYPRYFEALEAGRSIDAEDAHTDPRTEEFSEVYLKPLGISSMLDASIRIAGKVVGVICCEQVGPPVRWRDDAVLFACEAANQAAQAVVNRDRKRSEEALRASEDRLKSILDSIQAGILLIDRDTRQIVDVNPKALELIGAPREEIVGKVCRNFICPADPCSALQTATEEEHRSVEQTLINIEGEQIPVLKTVIRINLNGQPYLLESFVDISEQKLAEEALQRQAEELKLAKEGLEIFVSDTTDREHRMLELKEEVNELLEAAGREPRYLAPRKTAALRSGRKDRETP